jgi:hypothetical protein
LRQAANDVTVESLLTEGKTVARATIVFCLRLPMGSARRTGDTLGKQPKKPAKKIDVLPLHPWYP